MVNIRFIRDIIVSNEIDKSLLDIKNTRKYNYVGSESAVNKASGLKGNGYNNWNKRFNKFTHYT